MLQLLIERDRIGSFERIHIAAQILGKRHRRLLRGIGIDLAHHRDRGQGVIHKVRLDL